MSRFQVMLAVALLVPASVSAQEPTTAATSPSSATMTDAANPPAATTPATTTSAANPTAAASPAAASPAATDDPNKAAEAQKPVDPASIKVERTSTGAKLFRITEGLVVEGQMQKPAAFYVLRRAAIPYDYAELRKSFLPKIGVAVKAPPF